MHVLFLLCLAIFHATEGCGQIVPGQGRNMSFTISGFTLHATMAYTTEVGVSSQVPAISGSAQAATTFIRGLIMRSVEDVLQQQGRSALLPDAIISAILQQLTVEISFKFNAVDPAKLMNCFIIDKMVTNLCLMGMCDDDANLGPVPPQFMMISGSFTTSNIIMAGWSRAMWQSVLNRVARNLSSGPFGANFRGASVTLN